MYIIKFCYFGLCIFVNVLGIGKGMKYKYRKINSSFYFIGRVYNRFQRICNSVIKILDVV